MSDKFDTDGSQVDIETATEIHNQTSGEAGSPKSDRTNSPDLSKVLPKLQKRISANSNSTSQNVDCTSSQNRNTAKRPSEDGEPPLDFNDIVVEKVPSDVVSSIPFLLLGCPFFNLYLYFYSCIVFPACPPRAQSEYYTASPATARLGDQFRSQLPERQHHRAGPELAHQHRGETGDREAPHAGHQPR